MLKIKVTPLAMTKLLCLLILAAIGFIYLSKVFDRPSVETSELAKQSYQLIFVSPDGKKAHKGLSTQSPTTFEEALKQSVTGDTIVMRGGDYRIGNLQFNQGITIQPFENEIPVLKGSLVANQWKKVGKKIWSTKWPHLFPGLPESWWDSTRHAANVPRHIFNNDIVIIDEKLLFSTGTLEEINENTFYIDYTDSVVYLGQDPTGHTVEISAHDIGLIRTLRNCYQRSPDKKGPVIKGITFSHYTYAGLEIEGINPDKPMNETDFGNLVVGTSLEHCTFSYCSQIGAILRGNRMTISNCTVHHTGTEGIYIAASSDVLLKKNVFSQNNIENIKGYYPAAVKIFNQCHRVSVIENKFVDLPFSNGIWFDVGNVDCHFINNWVEGVGNIALRDPKNPLWPLCNGFFFEISNGGICAGNVFLNCDNGILAYNSSKLRVYNNTLVNSSLAIGRTNRNSQNDKTFGWHSDAGPQANNRNGHSVVNNIFSAGKQYPLPLLMLWQPDTLCQTLTSTQVEMLNHNYYVREPTINHMPLIIWSPTKNERCLSVLTSPSELQQFGPFGNASQTANWKTFYQNIENKDFHISHPHQIIASDVPADIQQLLGIQKSTKYVGAFSTDH